MKKLFHILSFPLVKRVIALFIILMVSSGIAFAQEDTFGLQKPIETILNIFTSNVVRGIACIFLIILCIGLITTGRQEPDMFKKFIPWIAGTVLFMAAGTITKTFLSDTASVTTNIFE
jgi:type IV secretory pathway VirB2 component (pilin)